jgi:uncharacterized damage-inducible protein DinB
MEKNKLEVWLRGPIDAVPGLLQPVAHAILQAREEVNEMMIEFPDELLWEKPAGVASVGFHLQHLSGVLDRLFSYARAEQLTAKQKEYLVMEGKPPVNIDINSGSISESLVSHFNEQVEKSIQELKNTDDKTLLETRGVGRAQIPSSVLGLLFHAAEHTQRHVGQLLVTVKVVKHKS